MASVLRCYCVTPVTRSVSNAFHQGVRCFSSSYERTVVLPDLSSRLKKKIDVVLDQTPAILNQQKIEKIVPKKSPERLLVEQVKAIQLKSKEKWTEEDYDIFGRAEKVFATTLKGSRKYNEWQKGIREWIEKGGKN